MSCPPNASSAASGAWAGLSTAGAVRGETTSRYRGARPGRLAPQREDFRRLLPFFIALLFALAPTGEGRGEGSSTGADFQKGFTLGGWSRQDYMRPEVSAQIAALREAGVEWIALTPRWFQADPSSTHVVASEEQSPSDESLRYVVGLAQTEGLHVFLKPQVDVVHRGWRGEISFPSEGEWARWFQSYGAFIDHYAKLAAELHASLFCVGVELDGTRHRERDWRTVIRNAKQLYSGPVVYAANFGRERDIGFWDALDYVGIDAYYPVASRRNPTPRELESRWSDHLGSLRGWAHTLKRPVLFTEIGYRSIVGSGVEPWEWERSGTPSAQEQALLYGAALRAIWPEHWIAGIYWWQIGTRPPLDPAADQGFTPLGKQAWSVIRDFYSRKREASASEDPPAH